MRQFWLTLTLLISLPAILLGDEYDTRVLLQTGDWRVELTHDTSDGTLWCDANTLNRQNQALSLTAWDTGNIILFVFDSEWDLRDRDLRFLIDIDYDRWTIDGHGNDQSVSVFLEDPEISSRFLEQLAAGRAVAVYNQDERRLATFSLHGSRAALNQLMNCWKRIRSTDPFMSASDPF